MHFTVGSSKGPTGSSVAIMDRVIYFIRAFQMDGCHLAVEMYIVSSGIGQQPLQLIQSNMCILAKKKDVCLHNKTHPTLAVS
jgi:hypothetical protein